MSGTAILQYPIDLLGYTGASSQDSVRAILAETSKHFESSATRQKRKEVIDLIITALSTSHHVEGEAPVSEATRREAIGFVRKLPPTLPIPEVVVEPDGDVALEWFVRNYVSFLVGFSGKGIITYSGLFGRGRKTYGTEFISEAIPSSIVENIRRVLV